MDKNTLQYLVELRKRLLRCVLVVGLVFGLFTIYANQIYTVLALPLLKCLSNSHSIIATSIPGPFLVPFKSAFFAAVYITAPYWLYQIWTFISPALYHREQRVIWPLLISSSVLFYMGTLFAYFVVLPLVFHFILQVAPASVDVRPDIEKYFSFVMHTLFVFGLAFELPIAIMLLVWSGITSIKKLMQIRPYVIIAAFVLGMLLTPPDVISQILLAIPIWLLYELGLLMSYLLLRGPKKVTE